MADAHLEADDTTGDTVVWLPEHRVLFTGDITFSEVTPLCLMGSIEGSLEVLARMYFYGNMFFGGIINFITYQGDIPGFELDPHATVMHGSFTVS